MDVQAVAFERLQLPGDLGARPPEDIDSESIESLASDILQAGLTYPLSVVDKGDAMIIVDGSRRYIAIKRIIQSGSDMFSNGVPVAISSLEDNEILARSIASNYHSKKTLKTHELKSLLRLQATGDYSFDKLAGMTGMSIKYMASLMKLNYLSDDIKAMIDSGSLTLTKALAVVKLPEEEREAFITEHNDLVGEMFIANVSQRLNEISENAKAERSGKEAVFEAKAKLLSKTDILVAYEQAVNIYDEDSSDYNKGRLEALSEVVGLDERTVTAKKAEWEAKKVAKEEAKANRAKARSQAKIDEAEARSQAKIDEARVLLESIDNK